MDYGSLFLQLVQDAISREEEELRRLRSQEHSDVTTVRQYEELWIEFVVWKEALRKGTYPKLTCECAIKDKRADLVFSGEDDKPLAIFELAAGAPNTMLAKHIQDACRKLVSPLRPDAPVFVVGLVSGLPDRIEEWSRNTLKPNLGIPAEMGEQRISLNNGETMKIVLVRV